MGGSPAPEPPRAEPPGPATADPVAPPVHPRARPAAAGSPGTAPLPPGEDRSDPPRRALAPPLWRSYLALTRPGVLVLVTLSALPALVLDPAGGPSLTRGAAILAGTGGVAAACSALNALLERDRDARMERTRRRPLVTGALRPRQALAFGVATALASGAVLAASGGALAVALAAATFSTYLGVYTAWLKPRTPLATEVGAVPGAAAPLIADAAVDGRLSLAGATLFGIVFLWQMPHFWAIALRRCEEYERAGIPVLPLRSGVAATRRRMVAYAALLLPAGALPAAVGVVSVPTGALAAALGAWFLAVTARAVGDPDPGADRAVFLASGRYLALLLFAFVVDGLVRR